MLNRVACVILPALFSTALSGQDVKDEDAFFIRDRYDKALTIGAAAMTSLIYLLDKYGLD